MFSSAISLTLLNMKVLLVLFFHLIVTITRLMRSGCCQSRIFMQLSGDRHGGGRGLPGVQQRCRVLLLVRDDSPACRCSKTGVFATDGGIRDMTTEVT